MICEHIIRWFIPGRFKGELDHTLQVSNVKRLKYGTKTICYRCRQPITDEFFIIGLKKGRRNMEFHEGCVNEKFDERSPGEETRSCR